MSRNAKTARDAFRFSLRGMSTINSFVPAPAMRDDRINKILDERLKPAQEGEPDTARESVPIWGRFWLRGRRRAA